MPSADRWAVRREGGATYIAAVEPLAPYPRALAERLEHWAQAAPDRTFVARRGADGGWVRISYAEALTKARAIGSALLARRLDAERPVMILSGNGLEHALLALGCLYVGVPWCPVSPAYAQSQGDLAKLRYVFELMTPGLVFVDDTAAFARALDLAPAGSEIVAARAPDSRPATPFADLVATPPTSEALDAFAGLAPDAVAKFLLTSGSTGSPKAVINSHQMLCANQQMILQTLPGLRAEPPVLVDWLPWNHTFGGNKIFGLTLYNGGTLYIDDGRPAAGALADTLANLQAVSPSIYFNVPVGYEMLLPALEADAALRAAFFSRLELMFYAGAGLSPRTRDRLEALGGRTCGRPVPMHSGLGATETAPSCLWLGPELNDACDLGLPVPGVEVKLAPVEDKLEVRVRGPNVTPGYWRNPALTASAYDAEGFYCLGDAVRLADPDDATRGLVFDGRIAEDFKLSNGTWVSVGPLRTHLLAALHPLAAEVVIAGLNRGDVRALVFPAPAAMAAMTGDPDLATSVRHPKMRAAIAERLYAMARGQGAASRVSAVMLLEQPPSLDAGELTDKGSISQRGVLKARAEALERLYATAPSPDIVVAAQAAIARPFGQ